MIAPETQLNCVVAPIIMGVGKRLNTADPPRVAAYPGETTPAPIFNAVSRVLGIQDQANRGSNWPTKNSLWFVDPDLLDLL